MAFVKNMNVVREVLKNYINDSSLSYRKLGGNVLLFKKYRKKHHR